MQPPDFATCQMKNQLPCLLCIISHCLPLRKFTDQVQLFQNQLEGKEFFIFESFLFERKRLCKIQHLGSLFQPKRFCDFKQRSVIITALTICVPTLNARETISRLCFVLGPLRVFSANTKAERTSRRCSLYFLSEMTLFFMMERHRN